MKKLFLLLALFGVFATGCESLLPNEQTPNQSTIFITDSEGNYTVDAEGGEIVVSITTNIEYNVVIPEDAQSWLSVADTRAETRLEKLTFIIAPNSGTERRNAMVELVDNESNLQDVISITQRGKTQASANKEILYTTTDGQKLLPYDTDASVFGAILVSNTYKDGKGVLVFDSSVTSIGEFAFVNCRTLASITIPNSVTSIGHEAFGGCSGLTSITIPEKVTSIGNYAFYGCSSLKEFKGKFASNDGRCLIINGTLYSFIATGLAEYTIPQNVTTISVGVFKDCNNLKRITIPDSVTRIGMYAFDGCRGELIVNCNIPAGASYLSGAFYGSKFTSVTIGSGVTTIGDYAFYECSSLTSATIPDSVTTIGRDAFYECSSLTSATIPDSVTTIGKYSFYGCSSLTSVTIPDSVTEIGERAFYNCSSLTNVTIGNSVTTIGMSAFDGCRGELIVNCNIPAGASYLSGAFYGSKFTSVTIGSGVTTIGDYAFYNCDSLTSVTIPNSVTTIGRDAFYGCTGELIVNCNIPSASNSYDGAFYSSKFTSVTIGSGVTTIGDYAFYYCSSLTSVTIPDSVTTIGDYAFYICDSLTSVYCKATTPPVAILSEFGWWSAFSNNVSDLKIYVPMDSVEAYKSAEGWSIYADAIVGYDF